MTEPHDATDGDAEDTERETDSSRSEHCESQSRTADHPTKTVVFDDGTKITIDKDGHVVDQERAPRFWIAITESAGTMYFDPRNSTIVTRKSKKFPVGVFGDTYETLIDGHNETTWGVTDEKVGLTQEDYIDADDYAEGWWGHKIEQVDHPDDHTPDE